MAMTDSLDIPISDTPVTVPTEPAGTVSAWFASTALRDAVIEQVMRGTDDISHVYVLAAAHLAAARSTSSVIGRLASAVPGLSFADGMPMRAWQTGGMFDGDWRDTCPAEPTSVWEALHFMRAVYGTPADVFDDALEEYITLLDRSEV